MPSFILFKLHVELEHWKKFFFKFHSVTNTSFCSMKCVHLSDSSLFVWRFAAVEYLCFPPTPELIKTKHWLCQTQSTNTFICYLCYKVDYLRGLLHSCHLIRSLLHKEKKKIRFQWSLIRLCVHFQLWVCEGQQGSFWPPTRHWVKIFDPMFIWN